MECYKIENLSFTYPECESKTLDGINISIYDGEFVTICGQSGCGKTTMLRLLKEQLMPYGKIEGKIFFNGKLLKEYSVNEQASQIGFVMQNPDNQIVTDKVWHELAFGLESLGVRNDEIRKRVSEMASFFGIENWFYKKITELSGGQKQILNLASIMVMQPSVIILDEPTSQLDPIASQEFLEMLKKINQEIGTTVIIAEHRLSEVLGMSDRMIVLDNGKVIVDDLPNRAGKRLFEINHPMYEALPVPMRVAYAVSDASESPITIREGRLWLENYKSKYGLSEISVPKSTGNEGDNIIEVKDAWFRYDRDSDDVVKGLNLEIRKGEIFAIVGGNGSGKTTTLSIISGLNSPHRGTVLIDGEKVSKIKELYNGVLGVLPQNPQSLFVKKTVYLDLKDMLKSMRTQKDKEEGIIHEIAMLCKIEDLLHRHPYDLSGGEQQRVALAKVLLKSPQILLLDEPTKGMDAQFKEEFADILQDLKTEGVTIVMVSHDIEFCAAYADRCALFFDGGVTSLGEARDFFVGNSFYTTAANRMANKIIPNAVLAEDIIRACGKDIQKREHKPVKRDISKINIANEYKRKQKNSSGRNIPKRTAFAAFMILLAIPFTIYFGTHFLGDRKYYFISLLIILETIIPFCMIFESRKPQARELVIISVICAIAVAGRAAFFMLPQFKPVIAIVIIAGVCFGGETGFLVGVVTGFVSNFFFGQSPWTPWQMFAFGIIGFVGGILFSNGIIKKTKLSLSIFGFLSTLVLYGGVMNPATVIMYQDKITLQMILSSFAMGLPFDLIHAVSSVFFLWFISEPMIEKLERIKIKYGLL